MPLPAARSASGRECRLLTSGSHIAQKLIAVSAAAHETSTAASPSRRSRSCGCSTRLMKTWSCASQVYTRADGAYMLNGESVRMGTTREDVVRRVPSYPVCTTSCHTTGGPRPLQLTLLPKFSQELTKTLHGRDLVYRAHRIRHPARGCGSAATEAIHPFNARTHVTYCQIMHTVQSKHILSSRRCRESYD